MKNIVTNALLLTTLIMASCGGNDKLAEEFASPPATVTTGVYWYWMANNISKEGVVNDLKAMKQAGINSVFIGNIGGQGATYGNVKLFTNEWWDVTRTALKTAAELDIEVGMFNCPGWSHTGGPWIGADQTMRHLVASETRVTGGGKISLKLPVPQQPTLYRDWSSHFVDNENKPAPHYQDVRTLAVSVPKDYQYNLFDVPDAKIFTENMVPKNIDSLKHPTKVAPASPLAIRHIIPKGREASVTLKLSQPQDARSLGIYPASYCLCDGELQAKVNGEFVSVAKFPVSRIFMGPSAGFTPFAPIVATFDKIRSDEFRVVFSNADNDAAIGKIVLSHTAALDKYADKTLAHLSQLVNSPYTEYKWTSVMNVPGLDKTETALEPAKVIDVTDRMQADGSLVWDAPAGEWLVLRMGMTPNGVLNSPTTPQGRGWEMDKLNATVIPHHFDRFMGEILRRIPPEDRTTLRLMIIDSWEKGGQTFTDGFIDSMKSRYGYDPTPFLPVFTGHLVGSPEQSERFLWDVRRLAAEIIGNNMMTGFNAVAHPHGIETWIENYGDWGFPGEFLLYGKHADRIGGEFWTDGDMRYIDVAASCAHIYNKPRVYAEAFTCTGGYQQHPYSLKQKGDAAFAAGMTSCVLHVYIEQSDEVTYPGQEAWFGVEFNRKNTWFRHIDLFTDYLKRCGLMLEQGLNVADIAYFIGEDVPVNSGPFRLPPEKAKDGVSVSQLPEGYSADYVNSDVIMNSMSVKNGRIVLPHGASYRLLVLPPIATMRPEVLKSIERLVADGATVLGEAPLRSPSLRNYPEADKELNATATKMWGDRSAKRRTYNKGVILSGMTIEEALAAINLAPDVKTNDTNVVYSHRSTAGREIYFIANQSDKRIEISPEFRVAGKRPELWNPVTGGIRPLTAFEQREETTVVPLQMEPYESMFIVFAGKGKPQSADMRDNFPYPILVSKITAPWTVTFESDSIKRGPAEAVAFDKLQSWTANANDRIRYYSGTAVYTNTFNLETVYDGNLYIEFDKVGVMAKVKINGQYAGGVWTPPYRTEITNYVKAGENTIEIEVVNTWVNRFIGDSFLPKEQRILNPFGDRWQPTSELHESGLMGTVRIINISTDTPSPHKERGTKR